MSLNSKLHFIGTVRKTTEEETHIEIHPDYCKGLKGIEEYSHIIILYWMHLCDNEKDRKTLQVFPRRHKAKVKTGVFACRSPSRPNPVGLSVVELLEKKECLLRVRRLDALEGSPIVDIKPYVPHIDSVANAHAPQWTRHGVLA
ncbi:MAG: tRNA (N6-threonylcarbamoyladenosine(37)-N6)-methyltransferase TrmO [Candidatus Bathyarchaeota archaeon]|nr:tRNA (N6-threonylcarbamoyladenosine(37)-N6)-methyltransferase TrmO [Candidatus Bathyarchaeota archaeon]